MNGYIRLRGVLTINQTNNNFFIEYGGEIIFFIARLPKKSVCSHL